LWQHSPIFSTHYLGSIVSQIIDICINSLKNVPGTTQYHWIHTNFAVEILDCLFKTGKSDTTLRYLIILSIRFCYLIWLICCCCWFQGRSSGQGQELLGLRPRLCQPRRSRATHSVARNKYQRRKVRVVTINFVMAS